MKKKSLISLIIVILCVQSDGFEVKNADNHLIALEEGSQVTGESTLYLPLGWPARFPCLAAVKLENYNVMNHGTAEWWLRPDHSTRYAEQLHNKNRTTMISKDNTLHLKALHKKFFNATIECRVLTSHNQTLVSRYRIEVQDCESRAPPDALGYNLHNPCGYGKCYVEKNRQFCGCFRHYTGLFCQKIQLWSLVYYFAPIAAVALLLVGWIIAKCCHSAFCSKQRKEERPLELSKSIGYTDRTDLSFDYLFPFQRRIRACRYDTDEDIDAKAADKRKDAEDKEEAAEEKGEDSQSTDRPRKRKGKKAKRSKESKPSLEAVEPEKTVDGAAKKEDLKFKVKMLNEIEDEEKRRRRSHEKHMDEETSQSMSMKGPLF